MEISKKNIYKQNPYYQKPNNLTKRQNPQIHCLQVPKTERSGPEDNQQGFRQAPQGGGNRG